ncbi:hypothetical protein C2845_PM15G05490 [Panicum miliaceum]|uniref:SAM domain-containing protein n=1 Tax=Panicum miliaceum TaxID=4540 RepID=A0A3L6QD48_PANMI|nr:hypothetical protein C2845_PM15G05490 [Panicum miliaceum]
MPDCELVMISTGRKRSIHERLDGDLPADAGAGGRARHTASKRQRQIDDKWKHDLYREDDEPASKSIGPRDLRLKLQMRSSQLGFSSAKSSGVRDLREKLYGTMHPQPSNADPPKPKPVSEIVKISRREAADEMPVRQSKKASKQPSAKKTSQPKAESPLDSFLSSLGLEKYSITFQAEEVDMAALRHMTDSDLKALGIPMVDLANPMHVTDIAMGLGVLIVGTFSLHICISAFDYKLVCYGHALSAPHVPQLKSNFSRPS